MSPLLRCAIICGAVPLGVGTLIFCAWFVTRWEWLIGAGAYWIIFGLGFFFVGLGSLVGHVISDVYRRNPFSGQFGRLLLTASLLLVNFPAALFYAIAAGNILTTYTLKVVNESSRAVEAFVVEAPGVKIDFGPLQADRSAQRNMHFGPDGELIFTAREADDEFTGVVESYVTSGFPAGLTILRLQQNRSYTIERCRRHDSTTSVETFTAERVE